MPKRLHYFLIVPLLLFVTVAVVVNLNADPVDNGEYHSVRHTGQLTIPKSPIEIVQSVADTSPQHAPLYFVLLSGWIELVGTHPVVMRVLSLFPLLLSTAIAYRLGVMLMGTRGGLFTAFLMAGCAYAVFYSHEIRMYSYLVLLSIGVIYSYWRIMSPDATPTWRDWLSLWLTSVLILYFHYAGIFALIGVGIYHLTRLKLSRRWFTVGGVEALVGLAFLPWLPIFLSGMNNRKELESVSLGLFDVLYHLFFVYSNGLLLVAVVLSLVAIFSLRQKNEAYRLVVISGLGAVLSLAIINQFAPILPIDRLRYSLVVLPFFVMLFGLGLLQLARWRWLIGIVCLAWLVMFFVFPRNPVFDEYTNRASKQFSEFPSYHRIADMLDTLPGYGEPIITLHPSVDVLLNVLIFYSEWTHREITHLWNDPDPETAPLVGLRLDIIADDSVLMLAYDPSRVQPDDILLYRDRIADEFNVCRTIFHSAELQIDYLVRNHIPCDLFNEMQIDSVSFVNGFRLDNILIDMLDRRYFRIYTWWHRVETDVPMGFVLDVVGADGEVVKQETFTMPPKSIGFNDIDVSDLPVGGYFLHLGLFDLQSGTVIDISGDGVVSGTEIGEIILE